MKRFALPTAIYSGADSLEYLRRFQGKTVWIVCDPFLANGAAVERLKAPLVGNHVSVYSDIQPDPNIKTVVAGIEVLLRIKPNVVIGFGGGSAIDAAKAMVFFAGHLGINIDACIAIPTTSGTGSEVTSASVITDSEKGIKYPLFERSIYPDIALLDPEFVVTVPPKVTANTGMDVLTHALEAYVATNSTDFSDALAEKAIHIVFRYLPVAYENGACLATREKLHNASCLAGTAFGQSGLGLNHAIAHQLGGQFHIAHGLANAILLTHVVRFNARFSPRAAKRYARLAKHLRFCQPQATPETGVNQLIFHIQKLQKQLQITASLRALDVNRAQAMEHMSAMVNAALNDSTLATSPYQPSAAQVRTIIEALL